MLTSRNNSTDSVSPDEAIIRYQKVLSFEAPAKRTVDIVNKSLLGDSKDPNPQFSEQSGMYDLFRDKFWGTKDFSSDLISLRRAGQEDLLSRIVSKAKWPFRIPCIGVSTLPHSSFSCRLAGWQ